MNMNEITKELLSLADEKYREFHSSLVPGAEGILGVRAPLAKALAKRYANTDTGEAFLSSLPHTYYDEYLVHAYMIGFIKGDTEKIKGYITDFLPYIDNWAICDSFVTNLKNFFKKPDEVYGFVKETLDNTGVYYIRFALVAFLAYYIDSEHIDEVLYLTKSVRDEAYYVRMAQAWLISVALVKEYEKTVPALEKRELSAWVHNKSIQKAKESFRISEDKKRYLSALRVKGEK